MVQDIQLSKNFRLLESLVSSHQPSVAGRMKVRDAVKDLTENQRMATILFYFHEKSYEEIAKIMDQPMNTIKSHIHRAKAQLAETLIELRKNRI